MVEVEKNKCSEVFIMCEKNDLIDDVDLLDVSLVEKAREIVLSQPDVREDVILKIKERYSDPNYEPDLEDVADGILEELKILEEIKKNL